MKYFTFLALSVLTVNLSCNNKTQNDSTNTVQTKEQTMDSSELKTFAQKYATAWCSQKPDSVAAFFAENGSLTINNGTPSVGRKAIAQSAESFMTAFPDMVVSMDSLVTSPQGTQFHWTLTGTNTGPQGTGKKVRISGFELWQFDEKGLVEKSLGSFDPAEYNRQLQEGVKK